MDGSSGEAPAPGPVKHADRGFSLPRSAPDEVTLASVDSGYLEYREMTDMREPYRSVGAGSRLAGK